MLFVLTGDIQTGKTRWLQALVDELSQRGVSVCGVLAPGVWRERSDEEMAALAEAAEGSDGAAASGCCGLGAAGGGSGAGGADGARVTAASPVSRFEKLGIDNVLLPQGEVVQFARRRDLAMAEGTYAETSESARANLSWEMSDAALARVNEHLASLAAWRDGDADGGVEAGGTDEGGANAAGVGSSDANLAAPIAFDIVGAEVMASNEGASGAVAGVGVPALLVIDEVGPLELLRGGGLVEAVSLLERGASEAFPHALMIVREALLEVARERFEGAWGSFTPIAPDDAGRAMILDAVFDWLCHNTRLITTCD